MSGRRRPHDFGFRGSLTQPAHSLSTLRPAGYPNGTQDSLPAAQPAWPGGVGYPLGPAWPGGVGYPLGPSTRFQIRSWSSSSSRLGLAHPDVRRLPPSKPRGWRARCPHVRTWVPDVRRPCRTVGSVVRISRYIGLRDNSSGYPDLGAGPSAVASLQTEGRGGLKCPVPPRRGDPSDSLR